MFFLFSSAIQSLPGCLLLSLLTQLDYLTDMTSRATWQFKEFWVLQRGLRKSQDHVSENKHNMCVGVSIIRVETISSVNFRYVNVMMTFFFVLLFGVNSVLVGSQWGLMIVLHSQVKAANIKN